MLKFPRSEVLGSDSTIFAQNQLFHYGRKLAVGSPEISISFENCEISIGVLLMRTSGLSKTISFTHSNITCKTFHENRQTSEHFTGLE